jgi:hypothetical protein
MQTKPNVVHSLYYAISVKVLCDVVKAQTTDFNP